MNFYQVVREAIEKANRTGNEVEFTFNGVSLRAYPNVKSQYYLEEIYHLRKTIENFKQEINSIRRNK